MPPIAIQPAHGPLQATVRVPGSKSITNRALICAALARGESAITGASDSTDTALLANALNQLGVLVRTHDGGLIVEGTGGRLFAPKFPIPVGNAGTTFRFLVSLAALANGTTKFELAPRMAERPIDDLAEALRAGGKSVTRDPSGLIVTVTGGGMAGGVLRIRAEKSSQFLSSLMLTAPYAASSVRLEVEGLLSSAPYVRMTEQVMHAFGVEVVEAGIGTYEISAPQRYTPSGYAVEADASSATYPMAAAAIVGGSVRIPGLPADSLQGDAWFMDILRATGAEVTAEQGTVVVEGTGVIKPLDVDMNAIPDTVPTLVAMALFASGPTRIRNVGHLRYKESNRIETLAEELGRLGANITIHEDGLEIHPSPLHGTTLNPHDDHRLAMSFALIGLRIPGVIVEQPECVRKSFPRFWEELKRIED